MYLRSIKLFSYVEMSSNHNNLGLGGRKEKEDVHDKSIGQTAW